jgi:beta-glucosidase/6-phospho-beta-glucosidase/beta-galactosidase
MFKSFFIAGFECATGYNRHREWIDQVEATQHDKYLEEDYARLQRVGIHTVREGIRWPLIDRRGKYDLTHIGTVLRAAENHGIQVIFDLFHYGYPDDVDLFSDEMPERFASYAEAIARYITANADGPHFFTPVNEPSYYSWAGGEVGLFAPHATGRGDELKYQLVAASIAGMNAIWSVCPDAEMVHVDPICHVVPKSEEEQSAADNFNHSVVFQSLDMLAGRRCPELGGSRKHLGTIGINYYWNNQWVLGGETLDENDERRVTLGDLMKRVHDRYQTNIMIGETAHRDENRPAWLRRAIKDVVSVLEDGVPVQGFCLYPILSMPEWHARDEWTHMGLWDLRHNEGILERHAHEPSFEALREGQSLIGGHLSLHAGGRALYELVH